MSNSLRSTQDISALKYIMLAVWNELMNRTGYMRLNPETIGILLPDDLANNNTLQNEMTTRLERDFPHATYTYFAATTLKQSDVPKCDIIFALLFDIAATEVPVWVSEMNTALSQDGLLLFACWSPEMVWQLPRVLSLLSDANITTPLCLESPQWGDTLYQYGFRDVVVEATQLIIHYDNLHLFLNEALLLFRVLLTTLPQAEFNMLSVTEVWRILKKELLTASREQFNFYYYIAHGWKNQDLFDVLMHQGQQGNEISIPLSVLKRTLQK